MPGRSARTRPRRRSRIGNVRSILGVPLLREGEAFGAIGLARGGIEPFAADEIELVKTFADQAVIAIENARLIAETREALEQQTATAEVLQVINASPGDLAPVFDAMLEKALGLCSAAFGVLWIYDGEFTHAAAIRGATVAYREFLSAPHRPGPGSAQLRLIQGERYVHVRGFGRQRRLPLGRCFTSRRSILEVGAPAGAAAAQGRCLVGAIMIYRQQAEPFTDKQIALLQNFAARR